MGRRLSWHRRLIAPARGLHYKLMQRTLSGRKRSQNSDAPTSVCMYHFLYFMRRVNQVLSINQLIQTYKVHRTTQLQMYNKK